MVGRPFARCGVPSMHDAMIEDPSLPGPSLGIHVEAANYHRTRGKAIWMWMPRSGQPNTD